MKPYIKPFIVLTAIFAVSIMLSGISIALEEIKMILSLIVLAVLIIILPMKTLTLATLRKGQIVLGFYISGYILTLIYIANTFSGRQQLSSVFFSARPLLYSYIFSQIITLLYEQYEKDTPIDFNFTKRESEIIKDLEKGMTNKEIADSHYIAESTVKRHIHNILKKSNCKNRVELLKVLNKKSD